MNTDLLDRALGVASTSSAKQYRHGAIVFYKRGHRIISGAVNVLTKTHPIQAKNARKAGKPKAICLHAEIHAIIKSRGKGDSLLVTRITKDGSAGNSKPCSICQEAIRSSHIKHVFYTDQLGEIKRWIF